MSVKSVTLDVSNFSGWSNDIAPCMVVNGRREVVLGIRSVWQAAAHFGMAFDHRRTPNIWNMSLTLAVSKLSGWLKDLASCRVRGGVLNC